VVVPAYLGAVLNEFHIQSVREKWNAHRSLFLCLVQYGTRHSMATTGKVTDKGTKELVLESNSDAHSSEDKDISAQSDNNTEGETDDVTDTTFTQWTDNTNCQPTVPIVVYRGYQWVMTNRTTPHQLRLST